MSRPAPPNEVFLRWRAQTLRVVMRTIFVLGLLLAVPSAWFAWRTGQPAILVADGLALAWLAFITFWPRLSFPFRAWSFLGLMYLFSLFFMGQVLLVGLAYLLALAPLAGLLLGTRAAVSVLVLKMLTLLGFGLAGPVAVVPAAPSLALAEWLVMSMNFVFVSAIMVVVAGLLLRRLESSLTEQQATLSALEEQRRRLQRTNRELAQEVEVREQAEAASRRLALVVEQSPVLVLIAAHDGHIEYSNGAARRNLGAAGLATGTVQALDVYQGMPGALHTAITRQQPWRGTLRFERPESGRLELETSVTPLLDPAREDHPPGFVVAMADVTRERSIEARLRQAEKLEAVGTFAGGIAHDFNNIIGVIQALAEEAQEAESRDERSQFSDRIVLACQRARDVVQRILLFSRSAGETGPLQRIALQRAVEETLPLLRALLPAGIRLDLDLDESPGIRGHAADVHQILLNLAANAAHAMAGLARGVLRIGVHVAEAPADSRLAGTRCALLEVEDNGRGMTEEQLQRSFDPFYTTKPPSEGSGLGLSSVHGIVQGLDGEIRVESTPGQGCRFQIWLPCAELPEPDAEPQQDAGVGGAGGSHVLLADDEAVILDMTARYLRRQGYTVTLAADGAQALDAFKAAPQVFDILVTDRTMPGLNGELLVREVRAQRPDLPVILVSGFHAERMADPLQDEPGVVLLAKPFSQKALARQVAALLAARH